MGYDDQEKIELKIKNNIPMKIKKPQNLLVSMASILSLKTNFFAAPVSSTMPVRTVPR
ncbi:hypothetical protein D3C86_1989030 [compost metagenome]